jgi:acyl dehydratase
VRFLKPVYPGDSLFVRATILEILASTSRPDRGMVRMSHETIHAASQVPVLTAEAMHRLRRRASTRP